MKVQILILIDVFRVLIFYKFDVHVYFIESPYEHCAHFLYLLSVVKNHSAVYSMQGHMGTGTTGIILTSLIHEYVHVQCTCMF